MLQLKRLNVLAFTSYGAYGVSTTGGFVATAVQGSFLTQPINRG